MPVKILLLLASVVCASARDSQYNSTQCPTTCECLNEPPNAVVSCIDQELTTIPIGIPTKANIVDLSFNRLTTIPTAAFQKLSKLRELLLYSNDITSVHCNAFTGLRCLTSLDLSDNKILALPSCVFRGLLSLQQLSIEFNYFTVIPELMYVPHLIDLSIGGDTLGNVVFPPSFVNITSLKTIELSTGSPVALTRDSFNSLTPILTDMTIDGFVVLDDNVFSKFVTLKSFTLLASDEFEINATTLMRSLSSCTNLRHLHIIGPIDLTAFTFTSLSKLALEHVNLDGILNIRIANGTFQPLSHLTTLDISGDGLEDMLDLLHGLTHIRELSVHSAGLKLIPRLDSSTLTYLDLSLSFEIHQCHNNTFQNLPNLESLLMSVCSLISLHCDCFRGLHKLEKLDMSGNNLMSDVGLPLDSCGQFSHFPNLKLLYLNHNRLRKLDKSTLFDSVPLLKVLDLRNNLCSYLAPHIFSNLLNLLELNLQDNLLAQVVEQEMGILVFRGLTALQTLRLNRNGITVVMPGIFEELPSLQNLDLSRNFIVCLDGIVFPNMIHIDMTYNRLSLVSAANIHQMSPILQLDLTGNVFSCSCDLIDFRRWIRDDNISETRLPGLSGYQCQSSTGMPTTGLLDFDSDNAEQMCFPPPWQTIIITVSVTLVAVFILSGLVSYRYRWLLRLRIYHAGQWLARLSTTVEYRDVDDDTEFDLLVSYNSNDEGGVWVRDVLIPTIDRTHRQTERLNRDETQPSHSPSEEFDIFFEERDVPFNRVLIGSIMDAMAKSRKVMLVVTECYLKDGRFKFEMEQAVYKSCSSGHGVDDVIVVLFSSSLVVRLMPSLHGCLTPNKVLRWTPDDCNGKQLFWQQLHNRLLIN